MKPSALLLSCLIPFAFAHADSSAPSTKDAAARVLRSALRAHPKIEVVTLTELDRKQATAEYGVGDPSSNETVPYGFRLHCRVAKGSVADLTRFRRHLKEDAQCRSLLPTLQSVIECKFGNGELFEEGPVECHLILLGPSWK